jgi:anti-sigma B factor antagonist
VLSAGTGAGAALGLSGEVDRDGAVRLRALLDDAIAPRAVITLDLSRVTHLSQAALAVLVQAHRRLRDSGGVLTLSHVSDPVVRVLRISGLHRVFDVQPAAQVDQAPGAPPHRRAAGA